MSDMSYNRKIINTEKASAHTTINAITTTLDEYQETNANAKNETSAKYNDSLDLNEFVEESKPIIQEETPIYQQVGATIAVGATSILSGVLDVGESLLDGVVWCSSTIASWFGADTKKAKEFISRDLVTEANEAFYENTKLGQAINDASYMKYDSETAQKIRKTSEGITKVAAATATTLIPGMGAASPLLFGFASGTGNKSEKLYQNNINTTSSQELGIAVSGVGEAANWFALSKLGTSAISLTNAIKTTGIKTTGSVLINGIKTTLKNIKTNGLFNTTQGIISNTKVNSLIAMDNLTDSIGIIGDNVSNWLVKDEEFNATAATKAIGELVITWLLNITFDSASNYLKDFNIKPTEEIEILDLETINQYEDLIDIPPPITASASSASSMKPDYLERLEITTPNQIQKYEKQLIKLSKKFKVTPDELQVILDQKIKELVDDSYFGKRTSISTLETMLKTDGYMKSQFEVNGNVNALTDRLKAENEIFSLPDNLPLEDRPVYGQCFPNPKSSKDNFKLQNYIEYGPGNWYGNKDGCVLIFDKDKVIEATTITVGDSLDYKKTVSSSLATNPQFRGAFDKFLRKTKNLKSLQTAELTDLFAKHDQYLELQFHGQESHSLDNIKEVIFTTRSPDSSLLKLLDEYDIKYRIM